MANSLEIFQNTLLKLVVRSGPDSDRQNVVLDVGEIGYTTDTKRLYVGDGSTSGGILAGNVIFGDFADFATITSTPVVGDLLYITGNSTLYRYIGGVKTLPTSWSPVGRIYSASDTTLVFSNSGNQIKVGTLSAGNFSNDAIGSFLTLDTGRIALSSSIAVDRIDPLTTRVAIPSSLKIGAVDYKFPPAQATGPQAQLVNDGSGNLSWVTISSLLTASSATLVPGPGISLLVNGLSSTRASLLTSGNVQINGKFIPTAFVEYKQNGTITRNVGVTTVEPLTLSELTALPNTQGAIPLSRPTFRTPSTEPSNIIGAWRVTLNTNVVATSGIVEVNVKNARLDVPSQNGYIYSSRLDSRYFFENPNSNTLIVYTFVPVTRDYGQHPGVYDLAFEYPTAGSQDEATRFSVTIYE
jgi:hypothetical protein